MLPQIWWLCGREGRCYKANESYRRAPEGAPDTRPAGCSLDHCALFGQSGGLRRPRGRFGKQGESLKRENLEKSVLVWQIDRLPEVRGALGDVVCILEQVFRKPFFPPPFFCFFLFFCSVWGRAPLLGRCVAIRGVGVLLFVCRRIFTLYRCNAARGCMPSHCKLLWDDWFQFAMKKIVPPYRGTAQR